MAVSTGTWRATYNAIRDRLEADTNFNDYFSAIEYDGITEELETPYCRIGLVSVASEPHVITKGEGSEMILAVTLCIDSSDDYRIAEEMLRAMEVFHNAYTGGSSGDPTFGTKVLRFTFNWGDIFMTNENTMVANGEIVNQLQIFQMGGL